MYDPEFSSLFILSLNNPQRGIFSRLFHRFEYLAYTIVTIFVHYQSFVLEPFGCSIFVALSYDDRPLTFLFCICMFIGLNDNTSLSWSFFGINFWFPRFMAPHYLDGFFVFLFYDNTTRFIFFVGFFLL